LTLFDMCNLLCTATRRQILFPYAEMSGLFTPCDSRKPTKSAPAARVNGCAYAAEQFRALYAARQLGAGFVKSILRRIGSSVRAGSETVRHLLLGIEPLPEEEIGHKQLLTEDALPAGPRKRSSCCREVERNLDAVVHGTGIDPQVRVQL
jgi:hypothetical protein